jgi:hypothetical protein
MKTKIKNLIFLILIILSQVLFSSCENQGLWYSDYGLNQKSDFIEKVTLDNSKYIKCVPYLTEDAVNLSKAKPGVVISFNDKKVNCHMVSILDYTYDIEYNRLVSNNKGETRLIHDIHTSYRTIAHISYGLIIFYVFVLLLLFYFFVDYGNIVIIPWLVTVVVAIYLLQLFMSGNIITIILFLVVFIMAFMFEFIPKTSVIYKKRFHWLSFITTLITILIVLYTLYSPLILV